VTFRSDNAFTERFGRGLADGRPRWATRSICGSEFEVERYLDYHGDKLVRRFDANSYLIIGKAMDLHDVARGRGSLESAMGRIRVPNAHHRHQQRHALPAVPAAADVTAPQPHRDTPSNYIEIDSPHGHDAFLHPLRRGR
jgi:homoserine O-acetyltransferase